MAMDLQGIKDLRDAMRESGAKSRSGSYESFAFSAGSPANSVDVAAMSV